MNVVVIGDGPAGLSAALFLARGGVDVTVVGSGGSGIAKADLHNYLGVRQIDGRDFLTVARKQVAEAGGTLLSAKVEKVGLTSDGIFDIQMEDSDPASLRADHVILAAGKNGRQLVEPLGLGEAPEGRPRGRTSQRGLYVVGRAGDADLAQAVISAGMGAAAAVDILATVKDEAVVDWDRLPTS